MSKLAVAMLALAFGAVAVPSAVGQAVRVRPDCEVTVTLSASGTSNWLDNRATGCVSWTLAYSSTGFSAVSVEAQEAPDASGAAGSPVVWPSGGVYVGSLPLTSAASDYAEMVGAYSWVRIDATVSGSGVVEATLYGFRETPGRPLLVGALTAGDCVQASSAIGIEDAGAACGSGGGSDMPIYAQTTVAAGDTTSADATSFTDGAYTWAANQFCSGGAGQVYHLHAAALLTNSTADNYGLTVWVGGTEVAGGNGMYTATGMSSSPLVIDVDVTCIATGSSGSIEVSWSQLVPSGTSANSGSAVQVNPGNTAPIAVNTTSTVALQVKSRINGTGSETLRQTILTY